MRGRERGEHPLASHAHAMGRITLMAAAFVLLTPLLVQAIDESFSIRLNRDKASYVVGEPVIISATNIGGNSAHYLSCPNGGKFFQVFDENNKYLLTTNPRNLTDCVRATLSPGETVVGTWNQRHFSSVNGGGSSQVPIGNYTVTFLGANVRVSIETQPPQPPEGNKSFDLAVTPRWNLISVPVYTRPNGERIAAVTRNTCNVQALWSYDAASGRYEQASLNRLNPGRGYWLLNGNSNCTIGFSGAEAFTSDMPQHLLRGWNLVGGPYNRMAFADMTNNCNVESGPWMYESNAYRLASHLRPGEGYWVRVSSECNLRSSPPTPPS